MLLLHYSITHQKRNATQRKWSQSGADQRPHYACSFLWATAWRCLVGGLVDTNGSVSWNTSRRTHSIGLRINETSLNISKSMWIDDSKNVGNDAPCECEERLLDTLVNFRWRFHEANGKFIRELTALLLSNHSLIRPIRFVTNKDLINTFWGMLLNVWVPGPDVWWTLGVRFGRNQG